MSHKDLRVPQHGGLKGMLPNALVRGEEVQLDISRQVYGQKVSGQAGKRGLAGTTGATGQGRPPGAYWVTPGGGLILVPVNAVEVFINGACTIQAVNVACKGGPGSCTIKIWKSNFVSGHYPPIITDDITGGANIVLTSVSKYSDSVLSGWSTSLAVDDCLLFSLSASANFTTVAIGLRVG